MKDCIPSIHVNSTYSVLDHLSDVATSKGFRMASININSLLKHIDELRVILEKHPLDVLAIN